MTNLTGFPLIKEKEGNDPRTTEFALITVPLPILVPLRMMKFWFRNLINIHQDRHISIGLMRKKITSCYIRSRYSFLEIRNSLDEPEMCGIPRILADQESDCNVSQFDFIIKAFF